MTTTEPPRRYFEEIEETGLGPVAEPLPVALYMETTNRCNLLCQTCPRTFDTVEKPGDLTLDRVRALAEQIPDLKIAVLHGIGEPMMNRELPEMVQYLKGRGARVLFNSNGTLLNRYHGRNLIEAGLDEIRISLDAADAETFARVRGLPRFDLILKNLRSFGELKREMGVEHPKVSLWLVGLKETIHQLPAFVELAHDLGIEEVYLQRLVYFDDEREGQGVARSSQGLFGAAAELELSRVREAEALASSLGVKLQASGATSPEQSVMAKNESGPWTHCRRPWALMYITANGNVLPCAIAPFVEREYDDIILGNAFEQPLEEIWNGPRYQAFRRALLSESPERCCRGCGVRWSL